MVYQPNKALHPGLTLQRVLDSLDMTQRNLSERTGLSEKHLSQIINGEASITIDTALLLENALGGSAAFWANLEKNHQETTARLDRESLLEDEVHLLKNFPYKDLVTHGYIEDTKKPKERVYNLWKFFGVNSLAFVRTTEAVAYRKKDGSGVKSEALAAWLRCGEIESKKLSMDDYDVTSLKSALADIRKMTAHSHEGFFVELQDMLSNVGVGLVCVPHFAHTQVHGATRWIGKNPILQLSVRGRDADKFWFTLFHELGHILTHGKKEEFLEFDKDHKDEKEAEADEFAQKTLLPALSYKEFVKVGDFSSTAIKLFASSIEVDPGIVLGRLKHDKLVGFAYLNHLHSKLCINGQFQEEP